MKPAFFLAVTLPLFVAACVQHPAASGGAKLAAAAPKAANTALQRVALPGAPASGGIWLDYIAYDAARHQLWVPAGATGSVDVVDVTNSTVSRIEGFPTKTVSWHGRARVVGPSSATIGDGVVYTGNRGDSSVCAIDPAKLKVVTCGKLDSSPDGIAFVASTKEVWVTTPRDNSIRVLDATTLAQKARIPLDGRPEGYAVDNSRGRFYTNLEDKDRTLVIDLATHEILSTWMPACGEDGPKGLAMEHATDVLFLACPDHVLAMDAAHDGQKLATLDVGAGIDAISYVESRHELFVAAGHAAKLVVARFADRGLTPVSTTATAPGVRNAVGTETGDAWMTDSRDGAVVVVHRAGG